MEVFEHLTLGVGLFLLNVRACDDVHSRSSSGKLWINRFCGLLIRSLEDLVLLKNDMKHKVKMETLKITSNIILYRLIRQRSLVNISSHEPTKILG